MNNREEELRVKFRCLSVIAILLIAVSTSQLSSIVLFNGNLAYAYSTNQAQSLVNDCGIDGASATNCANNGPLMQGNGLASSPIITQFGGQGQHGPPGPPGPPGEQGPPGPSGPDKKIQTRIVESEVGIIPPEPNFSLITATCAADEVATGGGHSVQEQLGVDDNLINYQVIEPDVGQLTNVWELRIQNSGPETIVIQAFAVCTKLVDAL